METVGTATRSQTAPTAQAKSALSGDMDTFLRLLTAQLRNQDPLKPMEPTEFAVQLATFSSVEQQVRTNDFLEKIAGEGSLSGMADLAGWVGMEARVAAPVQFSGAPVSLNYRAESGADAAVLVTYDSLNREVKREAVSPTATTLTWVGSDGKGGLLPNGSYSFKLESVKAGEVLSQKPVEVFAVITEVQSGTDGPIVVLQGGSSVAASAVTALRRPG
jgi:flagellar basal-body rod modification protein FlgD